MSAESFFPTATPPRESPLADMLPRDEAASYIGVTVAAWATIGTVGHVARRSLPSCRGPPLSASCPNRFLLTLFIDWKNYERD